MVCISIHHDDHSENGHHHLTVVYIVLHISLFNRQPPRLLKWAPRVQLGRQALFLMAKLALRVRFVRQTLLCLGTRYAYENVLLPRQSCGRRGVLGPGDNLLNGSRATKSPCQDQSVLSCETVYLVITRLREVTFSPHLYIKRAKTDSQDTRRPDQMKTIYRSILASLLLIPSPLVFLGPFTANHTPPATNNHSDTNVLMRKTPDLGHLLTHCEPLRGPATADEFQPRWPLQNVFFHGRQDPDQAFCSQRASGEIYDKRNRSAFLRVKAYFT